MSSSNVSDQTVDRVVVAEIFKPRGVKGELIARSLTDVPGRLKELKSAWVHLADGSDTPVTLEVAWEHRGDWILKFAKVDSVDAADRFRGGDLWVPRSERSPLPEGEFYETDLVGSRVFDIGSGVWIGTVSGWRHYGGPPLMEVAKTDAAPGTEVLVPFVPAICRKVNLEARTIEVDLPEGLLDL